MNREKLLSRLRQIEKLVAECLRATDELPTSEHDKPAPSSKVSGGSRHAPDFTLPLSSFVKKYARDKSGPERFALVLARMTKGQGGVEVKLNSIRAAWDKMTRLLSSFNPAFSTRAKDNGWVDSPRPGSYVLLPGWTEILRGKD